MNRIQNPAEPTAEGSAGRTLGFESALFAPSTQDSSHALFAPLHYEPKYAYPLLVWLHGPGKDAEHQLMQIMPVISMRNYVAVGPRGFRCGGVDSPAEQYSWPQTQDHIEQSEHRVFQSIEAAQRRYNVSPKRVFLAGFDLGGTTAFRVAMNHPCRFAGVLSICGGFPRGHNPFSHLAQARRLPVFLAVARDSLAYSPADACGDLRLFHTAGISVSLRQYPCGHQLTRQMLRDVDRWVIEQITPLTDPPVAPDNCWSRPSE